MARGGAGLGVLSTGAVCASASEGTARQQSVVPNLKAGRIVSSTTFHAFCLTNEVRNHTLVPRPARCAGATLVRTRAALPLARRSPLRALTAGARWLINAVSDGGAQQAPRMILHTAGP